MPDVRIYKTGAMEHTYAQALLELAEKAGQLDVITEQAGDLAELSRKNPDLARLLGTRALSAEERAQTLERLFKGRLHDLLYRFLLVVNHRNRLGDLATILAAFATLVQTRRGRIDAQAFVAVRLDPAQADAVASRIGAVLGKQVVLHQEIDPTLLGGLKLLIGDQLIDGSVATQLRLMKQQIVETGRQRARQEIAQQER